MSGARETLDRIESVAGRRLCRGTGKRKDSARLPTPRNIESLDPNARFLRSFAGEYRDLVAGGGEAPRDLPGHSFDASRRDEALDH